MGRRDKRSKQPERQLIPISEDGGLGDFGVPRPKVDMWFTWFGVRIRVHPDASVLREVDFVDKALQFTVGDPRNLTWILHQMRMVIHGDDFDQFWNLALENRQQEDDLIQLHQRIIAGVAQRPTGRSGDSSPGPQNTPPKSGSEPEPSDGADAPPDPVMDRLSKRPDLQLAVWRADQAEAAG